MAKQNQDHTRFNQTLVNYIKKTLFFGSKEFYREFAKNRDIELLTLDAPITSEGDTYYIDTIIDPSSDVLKEVCNHSKDIRDYVENNKLLQAMDSLNDKELYILYKLFVEEKNGAELGQELRVSKQYINKIKGQALKKIRNQLRNEVR
ncbi:sigma factor-like helix-turn-helix DNA-binding protein [Paramaledivibacter caminithermalis]|jgi:DNA-directed RNA polymerase specialized sigma subunit|uniref:Sigma-70, region 4 n=1 Tax=Paramaledivibacter caminithermalis (strain DSM 15212 / CIP 107654 / DViRD3) TaxID=1121301 RepID=A0A1M6SNP5_PARC5|nr:sigma factor-like helix-turn-helix DNA-binding protein [Paramaledivibacter caminithermalis]SHK46239.1 Sigma-70, region 4 [Paramaledivibacter caminithermalis DSM 15212]